MNRVGDMGLSIGFLALFALFGSLDYSSIFSLAPFLNETSITIIGLFLLIGAMAKSAQIPLHSWLPGSMEGSLFKILNLNLIRYSYLNYMIQNFTYSLLLSVYEAVLILSLFFSLYIEKENFHFLNFVTNTSKLPPNLGRDLKGRFVGKILPFEPLEKKVIEALTGELLGDGHLRFNKKGEDGFPKPNTNAQLAMTLKSEEYATYL
jgi:proton-conducting membrane transporter